MLKKNKLKIKLNIECYMNNKKESKSRRKFPSKIAEKWKSSFSLKIMKKKLSFLPG